MKQPSWLENIQARAEREDIAGRRKNLLYLAFWIVFAIVSARLGSTWEIPKGEGLMWVHAASSLWVLFVGWGISHAALALIGPLLRARMDLGTAGAGHFFLRFAFFIAVMAIAARAAGLETRTLVTAGAASAVILGIAAQQILANLLAGVILASARPYRVGDRIRLQAGPIAGQMEGRVISLGLLYTVFAQDGDETLVPNSIILASAVTPLRAPEGLDVQARLRPGILPSQVSHLLTNAVDVALYSDIEVQVMEAGEELVVRVVALPLDEQDGVMLADQVLKVLRRISLEEVQEVHTQEWDALKDELL